MFDGEPRLVTRMGSDRRRLLPGDWRWTRLGHVCETQSGGTPSRGHAEYYGGSIAWAKIEDLTQSGMYIDSTAEFITQEGLDNSSAKLLPQGTVLLAMYGSIGTASIATHTMTTNQAIIGCTCPQELLPEMLWYWLAHTKDMLVTQGRGGTQSNLNADIVRDILIPIPPMAEQRRIVAILAARRATVERAHAAALAQVEGTTHLAYAYLRQSLAHPDVQTFKVSDCTAEVTTGVGESWADYRLVGATRSGIAPAKEGVGKHPERYKLVADETIFYNPMRILLGSIAMIDAGEEPGITSPDYVVFRSLVGRLHPVWFYHWLRSPLGVTFIKTLARGAVRERMLYRRLASAEIQIPPWEIQVEVAEKLRTTSRLRASLTAQLDAINALPAALLRQAFTRHFTIDIPQRRPDSRIRRQMQRKLKGSQSARRRTLWALHYQPRLRMQQRRWSGSPHTSEEARKRFQQRRSRR